MDKPTESNRANNMEVDSNAENCGNNRAENPTRAAVDELIQENNKLKECVEAAQESKRKWRIRNRAFDSSNWKLELQAKHLRNQTDHLKIETCAMAEESQKTHDDLEMYRVRNKQEAANFWAHFQEETQKYSNLFNNSHIEYSSDCLKQDIEEYRRQSRIVRDMIEDAEKAMETLRAQYGLAELGTNQQVNLLADIASAKKTISDKSLLLRATKSAEDNIKLLKLKVKQKKDDIAYVQSNSFQK